MSLVAFAIFSSSSTFAYWLEVLGNEETKTNNIGVGEWSRNFLITVYPNGSDDFTSFSFEAPPNEPLKKRYLMLILQSFLETLLLSRFMQA